MPTKIKDLPSKEDLLKDYTTSEGFVYWKDKTISRGRKSVRAGRRVNSYIKGGYWRVVIKNEEYMLSRIVYQMTYGDLTSEYEIDHIDRDKNNNNPENLRKVSGDVNKRNRPFNKNKVSTNVTGVCLCKKKHPYPYQYKVSEYYVARWYDENGNLVGKSFNISKLGKEEAFLQACKYREEQIERLNLLGFGYSETHGKTSLT